MDFDLDNMDERYKKIYERFQKNETISAIDLERKIDHVISPKDSIHTINKHIKKDGLVLSKTRDETTGKSYLLLRHIYKTHDDCWKSLQVPGGATLWSTTEKTNLHEIATRILSEENKQVWVDSKDEEIRNTYERLLEHKWLNFEKKNSTLTLGPRFLGQMKPWIEWKTQKQYHCDACTLCVVRGYFCDDCDNAHHLMCLKKSKTDPKCQTCQSTMKNNLGLNEEEEEEEKSEGENDQKEIKVDKKKGASLIQCPQCSFQCKTSQGLHYHVQTKHGEIQYDQCEQCDYHCLANPRLKLNCDQCKHTSANITNLKNHIKTVHRGIDIRTHLCDKCDYKAACSNHLKRHIESVHEGIRYQCDQCEYKATEKGNLQRHVLIVHSGVKLHCDQCTYSTAQQRVLDTHMKFVHEGIGFTCDYCGHKTSTESNLKQHITRKHNK